MESNVKNIFEIIIGIAIGILFKWKIYDIYQLSQNNTVQVTLFFAGLFVFYLSLNAFKYFIKHYRGHGVFSFGTITGAAAVSFLLVIMFFVHTPHETIEALKGTLIVWGILILVLLLLGRRVK